MKIENKKTIQELQSEFRELFPYLKIEFYKTPHEDHKGSARQDQLDKDLLIGKIRSKHQEGVFEIHSHMTARELEDSLQTKYGLNVQVFRKSGPSWLQTIVTDDWTLIEMNERGKISTEGYST